MKLMLREGFDANSDGIIELVNNIVGIHVVGVGGVRAYQVVRLTSTGTIMAANAAEETQAGLVIGMTEEAGDEDEEVRVLHRGEISNDAWDLSPGAIYYLVSGGEISSTPPTHGFLQKVGMAKTTNILMLNLNEAIKLV